MVEPPSKLFSGGYTLASSPGHVHSRQSYIQQMVWSTWLLRWGSCDPPTLT